MKDQILEYYLDKGIEITMRKMEKDNESFTIYDLNTRMKSHAYLRFMTGEIKVYMRYGDVDVIDLNQDLEEIVRDITSSVRGCVQGRDYMDDSWHKLLTEAGYTI